MSPPAPRVDKKADKFLEKLAERKENAAHLAAGYSKAKQRMETACIFGFLILFTIDLTHLYSYVTGALTAASTGTVIWKSALGMATVLTALVSADFVGGFVHWAFDTWGSVNVPVVGQTFIRSFREHHVDPKALARHDWREANGDNCLATLPLLLYLSLCTITEGWTRVLALEMNSTTYSYLLILTFFVMLTNQIHKWAHMNPCDVPEFVKYCQRNGILLCPVKHNIHHKTFDTYYCITTGWCNKPLEKINFWIRVENLITKITGVQPRTDDLHWTVGGTVDDKHH
jgi:hypothetical protein